MKTPRLVLSLIAITSASSFSQGAAISQTFESGEDTSTWGAGSVWQGGTTTATFLDSSVGGLTAGAGSSAVQSFFRPFRDNTVGIDVTTSAYTISLYAQVELFDDPAQGQFEIMDGEVGASTANVRIRSENVGGGNYTYHWEAKNSNSWDDLGIEFTVGTPYLIEFAIDPEGLTYTPTVSLVSTTGTVLDSGTLSNLSFDQSVINNNQNGELRVYLEGSAGTVGAAVDNINITNIPEPAIPGIATGAALMFVLRRRRASAA